MTAPNQFLLYTAPDGAVKVEVVYHGETIWLTQKALAELFGVQRPAITKHLGNIFASGELEEASVCSILEHTAGDGKTYAAKYYNLDAIIAVGYRVNSFQATRFRIWATNTLREFIIKGFVLNSERLKNPPGPGVPDYFDELLERIRDIRASERRVYLRVREILALAADYVPEEPETQRVFQIVQNKLHFAATGYTAPELIASRADAEKPNMGLTNWKSDVVRKGDVTIAKNYLNAAEIEELNRIVVMFLDYAEDQARRRKQIFLKDWQERLDDFLRFNERAVLPHAGNVTREAADRRAKDEYETFAARRREHLEAVGEVELFRELEAAPQKFPKRKKPTAPDGGEA